MGEYAQRSCLSFGRSGTVSTSWLVLSAVSVLTTYRLYSSNYQAPPQWPPNQSRHSTYQSTPFAQSVIHHTSPSASYPTPPPPGISSSSSSLAGALGPPSPPKPPRQTYQPRESQAFFNTFLDQTPAPPPRAYIQPVRAPSPLPPQTQQPRSQPIQFADIPFVDLGSPDPLVAQSPPDLKQTLTPRKRKVEQYLESPTVKRVQIADPNRPLPTPPPQRTPTHQRSGQGHLNGHSQSSSLSRGSSQNYNRSQGSNHSHSQKHGSIEVLIQTPSKSRKPQTPMTTSHHKKSSATPSSSIPYVAVPPHPKAYHTPTSQRRERPEVVITTTSLSVKGKAKMKNGDDEDDLGGFGSEEDGMPLGQRRISQSSTKRATGDRDDRGQFPQITYTPNRP